MTAETSRKPLEEVTQLRAADAADVAAPVAEPQPVAAPGPRRGRRRLLIVALPVALVLAGGYVWATGGRYVSTEDAYVKQDRVSVMPQVSGQIDGVMVGENATVTAGETLFTIDPAVYRSVVDEDRAKLASARLEVEKLKAAHAQAVSEAATARDALATAETQDDRQQALLKTGVVPQATADDSALKLQQARGALAQAESRVLSARAALAGDPEIPTDSHPAVMEALATLKGAELDLANTTVRAPVDGVVSQTSRLQHGQYVTPAVPVLTLVATDDTWIEANFKETDLTHMTDGQQVEVVLDTFPDRPLKGEVGSIGAGTGSEFALLPAQNATGNWVKVVQRVPLRVTFDAGQDLPPLRSGMSASVEVDTGHARGLPRFIAGPLAALGLGGHTAVAAPADAAK
jgi:membrane fusion protein (multidrug efflux system)